eukprot:jgi/Undpi1/14282/HiC_scaffold_9.g03931.m1
MLFCPTDGSLLMVESGPQGWTRFCCQTCPYIHPMEPSDKITRKIVLKKKAVDDIMGGEDAWANVDKTQLPETTPQRGMDDPQGEGDERLGQGPATESIGTGGYRLFEARPFDSAKIIPGSEFVSAGRGFLDIEEFLAARYKLATLAVESFGCLRKVAASIVGGTDVSSLSWKGRLQGTPLPDYVYDHPGRDFAPSD